MALVLLVLVTACSATAPSATEVPAAAPRGEPVAAEDWIARSDDDAVFTVNCAFSHRAPDDPIVALGKPGASHRHDFFGSEATDATSTGEGLRGTATTCEDTADAAAYWVPTLSIDGREVAPTHLRAYYRAAVGADVRTVEAPPVGLAMITGHTSHHPVHGEAAAGASVHGDELPTAGWGCGLRPRRLRSAPPPDCTDRSLLTLQLRFPDCWDGRRLDSPDHRAHVTRSTAGRCPASHPVAITEVQVSVVWPITGAEAARAVLASGPATEPHGDFLNGWEPKALTGLVELCIHAKANCTIG